ncbi:restriction endonuclease subunit S [Pontibacter russatus]|uniref:restriction endonuclease subunit S n=1 Tax=Pontibacter russatus TaxID=2694929 RepID=UPI00192A619C|nr:restriction endonuclease subunit S [Pontibacter russatus]
MIPELRFPEFLNEGEWSYKNGDKLFESISNKNHNSDLPILAITQEQGAIPREMIEYHVSVSDKSVESYKVVEVGDYIISLRSFQGGIEYSNYLGLCSPAYIILRKKVDLVNNFYRHYFKSLPFIKDLNRNLEGIRDGKMVSYKQFSEILIPKPKESEQRKIASCLSSLDEVIAAHSQKLESLKDHKRGLMQILFPQEGEVMPKYRFPEFKKDEEWVEMPLRDVFSIFQGYAFSSNDNVPNGTRWLKIADVGIQQMKNDSPSFLPQSYKEQYEKFLLKKGDYVLALTRPILNMELKIAPVDDTFHNALLNQRVGKIVTTYDSSFVYYQLQTTAIIGNINKNIAGNEPPNLSFQQIENIIIPFPSNHQEQQKIAETLSTLDALIAAQADKIEHLKLHKKGLMQGLFPKIND